MALLTVTNSATSQEETYNVHHLRKIIPIPANDSAGTSVLVFKDPRRGRVAVEESLDVIFNKQQVLSAAGLNMIKVEIVKNGAASGEEEIFFTHDLRAVTSEGVGALLTFKDSYENVETVETVANIYALQSGVTPNHLGLVSVTLKDSASTPLLLFQGDFRKIFLNEDSDTQITMKDFREYVVNEAVAALAATHVY